MRGIGIMRCRLTGRGSWVPSTGKALSSAYYPSICVGSLHVLNRPPTVQKQGGLH